MPTTVPDVLAEAQGALEKATVEERDTREWVTFLKRAKAPTGEVQKAEARVSGAEVAVAKANRRLEELKEAEEVVRTAPARGEAIAEEIRVRTAAIADRIGEILVLAKEVQKFQVEHGGLQDRYIKAQVALWPGQTQRSLSGHFPSTVSPNWAGRDSLSHLLRLVGTPLLEGKQFSSDALAALLLR